MTNEELRKNLELMRAEVEWNYPIDYAATIDECLEKLDNKEIFQSIFIDGTIGGMQLWLEKIGDRIRWAVCAGDHVDVFDSVVDAVHYFEGDKPYD